MMDQRINSVAYVNHNSLRTRQVTLLVDQLEWFVLAVVVVVFSLTLSSSSNRVEDKGHLSCRPVWLGCACQELKAPAGIALRVPRHTRQKQVFCATCV